MNFVFDDLRSASRASVAAAGDLRGRGLAVLPVVLDYAPSAGIDAGQATGRAAGG